MSDMQVKMPVQTGTSAAAAKQQPKTGSDDSSIFDKSQDADYLDGKVSFGEGAKAFGEGAIDKLKEQGENLLDAATRNPAAAVCVVAGTASIGILSFLFAPVAVVTGAVGVGLGVYGAGKAAVDMYNNAKALGDVKNDDETLKLLHDMGGNTTELAENGLIIGSSAVTLTSGVNTIKYGMKGAQAEAALNSYYAELEKIPFEEITKAQQTQLRKLDLDATVELLGKLESEGNMAKGIIAEGVTTIPKGITEFD